MNDATPEDVRLYIELKDVTEFPKLDELRELFNESPRLSFQFDRISALRRFWIIHKLKFAFPEHLIQSWEGSGGVRGIEIARVLSSDTIRDHAPEIVTAVRGFVEIAVRLTGRLAKLLGAPVAKLTEFASNNDHWGGSLDADWDYWFHGRQVRFEHRITDQIVDVNLYDFENRESLLDVWFVLQYIRTTSELTDIARLFPDGYDDMRAALSELRPEIAAVVRIDYPESDASLFTGPRT
jgi:hypothetical protein